MSTLKDFKLLEKSLHEMFEDIKDNEVILRHDDFKDGKLTKSGYLSLKLQSDYVPITDKLEIKIPKEYAHGFKSTLQYVATKELIRIKKDRKSTNLHALIFFIIGIILLTLPTLIDFFKEPIINEIILIVSWVFVWASVEKKFFEMNHLNNKRQNILHILSSNYQTY